MAHNVIFAPEAEADLVELYDYIARHAGPDRALRYVERIIATCRGPPTFPERGTPRDDIRLGLRTTSHVRRVTIAFHVAGERLTIDRILYAGRTLGAAGGGTRGPGAGITDSDTLFLIVEQRHKRGSVSV